MSNPWDPPPPAKTHRICGTVAGHAYTGPWAPLPECEHRLAHLPEEYGDNWRIEAKADVDAAKERAERIRLRDAKRRLDAAGEMTVAEAAEDLRKRRVPAPRVLVMPGSEEPPFRTVKQAIGDYAAHCHGPKLAQISEQRGGTPNMAWLCVGTHLERCGLHHQTRARDRIIRWGTLPDNREGIYDRPRLSGHEWRKIKELREALETAGVIRKRGVQ